MKFPERVLATLQHKPIDQVVWQPSLMYWYNTNKVNLLKPEKIDESVQKYVPKNLAGLHVLELYKEIKGSIRYPHESLHLPSFYTQLAPNKGIKERSSFNDAGEYVQVLETPLGKLEKKSRMGFPLEYYVKKIEDLDVIECLLDNTEYCFNPYVFEAAQEAIEDLGVVQTYNFRSPYQRCVIEYLGFVRTTLFLRRHPRRMAKFIDFLEAWDEKAYKVILDSPLKVVSFGENIHGKIAPPPIFERYHLPYYKKRVKQIHEKGKLCHIHMDGDMKDLLPFFPELPFDGIEAVTFKPQGDITPEELQDVMGKKVLLDGIPAVLFLPEFPVKQLEKYALKLLEMFAPRLILGISDEMCPTMDGGRLKVIGDLVIDHYS
ncbi:MAG: uroporphyrinogen decarboxylase family protein [Candidatus Hodarchaeota archaeon]